MVIDIFEVPYYAVIFRAKIKSSKADSDYEKLSKSLKEIAKNQKGYLGFESQNDSEYEISISYWKTLEDIKKWKANKKHIQAQQIGKEKWYYNYTVRICKVEQNYKF